MELRILLCAEDILNATLARDICDRVVAERANEEWLRELWSPAHIESQRYWTGLDDDTWWSDRPRCEREADLLDISANIRIKETGRKKAFHGVAGLAFRTTKMAAWRQPRPDILVLAGDTDGQEDLDRLRKAGVAGANESLPVLVAEPIREAEAWIVAGFEPHNEAERDRLKQVQKELGFDPTSQPERMMSTITGDKRDSKRICKFLLGIDHISPNAKRAKICWLDTPLETLIQRGERTGLADYIRQIEQVLLPMLGDTTVKVQAGLKK